MHEQQLLKKEKIMKKMPNKKDDFMKNEYNFDYSKSKPNHFAGIVKERVILYPIDEDVAKVFRNPAEANNALRSIINALPKKSSKKQLSKTP